MVRDWSCLLFCYFCLGFSCLEGDSVERGGCCDCFLGSVSGQISRFDWQFFYAVFSILLAWFVLKFYKSVHTVSEWDRLVRCNIDSFSEFGISENACLVVGTFGKREKLPLFCICMTSISQWVQAVFPFDLANFDTFILLLRCPLNIGLVSITFYSYLGLPLLSSCLQLRVAMLQRISHFRFSIYFI